MRISDWSSDVCSSDLRPPPEIRTSLRKVSLMGPALLRRTGLGKRRTVRRAPLDGESGACAYRPGQQSWGPIFAWQAAGPRRQRPTGAPFSANASRDRWRSEEHTSELQSLMSISYAVFCLKTKKTTHNTSKPTK